MCLTWASGSASRGSVACFFVFATLLLGALPVQARPMTVQADLMIAGGLEKFDGVPLDYGMSLRSHSTLYFGGDSFAFGPALNLVLPGSIFIPDAVAGAGFRVGKNVYFESAGGLRWSPIWGIGFAVIVVGGVRLSEHFFVTLPVVYKIGFSLDYVPHIGIRF